MKLDPVNQKDLKGSHKNAKDKDINNDGKVNSSDEYLHNRRQAVSKAIGKLKEEAELDEERTGTYVGTVKRDDPDYAKKVAELKSKTVGGHRIRGRAPTPEHKHLYQQGGALYRSSSQDIKPEHSSRVDVYSRKPMKEEAEELDELSDKTLRSYIVKSHETKFPLRKAQNRVTGIERASDRLNKEEALDELSQDKLYDYHAKASTDLRAKRAKLDQGSLTMNDLKKGQNRVKGLNTAANKMKEEVEELDESWSDGISSRNAHMHASTAAKYRKKANDSAAMARNYDKGSLGHSKNMANYHSAMAKSIKSSYHAGDYGSLNTAKRDHKAQMDKSKEYKSSMSEEAEELDEVKKTKPGNNAMVMAKNIGKVLAAVKKEETDDASTIAKHTKPLRMKLAQFRHEE